MNIVFCFQSSQWSVGEKILHQIQQREDAQQDKPEATCVIMRVQQHNGGQMVKGIQKAEVKHILMT